MTRAQEGCSPDRFCCALCACCVWSTCLDWLSTQGSKYQLRLQCFLPFCLRSYASVFTIVIPRLFHLSVVSYFSLTPIFLGGVQKFGRKDGSCLLFADVQWLFFLFVTVGLDVVEWQRFPCPFPAMKSSTMSSLNWDIFGWPCPSMPCIVQFTWLCFLPQKLTKSIPLLLACQEAILCINLSFRRQATWRRWLILGTDNTSCL